MKELFQDKNFTLLFFSNLFSAFGTGITMIGIPWAIVTKQENDWFLGVVTIAPAILLLLLIPLFGVITDRFNQRTVLLYNDGLGVITLFAITLFSISFTFLGINVWLLLFYTISLILFHLKIPVIICLIQQTVLPKLYITANSVLEIVFQISHVTAGAVSIFLLTHLSIIHLLILNCLAYGISWILLVRTNYVKHTPPIKNELLVEKGNFKTKTWYDFIEAWKFLLKRPAMFIFFACSQFPNVIVKVGAYLFPLYVARGLEAEGSVYAQGEILYSIGALIAGILLRKIIRTGNNQHYLFLTSVLVSTSLLLITSIQSVSLFLVGFFLIGFGNAGSRISGITLLMETIPKKLIGRINSFLLTLSTMLRIILIFIFTINSTYTHVTINLLILGILSLFACIGILFTKDIITEKAIHSPSSKAVD
jgi:MFS family permease